jgi:uncharacterized membrane protein
MLGGHVITRDDVREYAAGALWVWPGVASLGALTAGLVMGRVDTAPGPVLSRLAFQGTADDARSLLSTISSTVVTVIALVLGLTVVALQLASTQFSPRLLRNFLRDRPTQVVLSVFLATFTYSTAGLYTVGVAAGARTEEYPRLAVSGALLLLFASLAMVVYFANHLLHSIQIDTITGRVEVAVLDVVKRLPGRHEQDPPQPPRTASRVPALRSGYIQAAHPELVLPLAEQHQVRVVLQHRVGEHVVAGSTLAVIWRADPSDPPPDPTAFTAALGQAVDIGFERTLQQDAAFGIRQLVDVACKALSPAVNDPYTAVQAVDHLSVIFAAMAARPLGDHLVAGDTGWPLVLVPGRRFGDYLSVMCGLIRRYGAGEPTVCMALLQLLTTCLAVVGQDRTRRSAIAAEADLIATGAKERILQPQDAHAVGAAAEILGSDARTPPSS